MALSWSSVLCVAQQRSFCTCDGTNGNSLSFVPLANRLLVSWRCGSAPSQKETNGIGIYTAPYRKQISQDGNQMLHHKNKQLVSKPYASQIHHTSSTSGELNFSGTRWGRLSPNPVIQLQLVDANVALNEQPQEPPVALTPKTSSRLVVPPGDKLHRLVNR